MYYASWGQDQQSFLCKFPGQDPVLKLYYKGVCGRKSTKQIILDTSYIIRSILVPTVSAPWWYSGGYYVTWQKDFGNVIKVANQFILN